MVVVSNLESQRNAISFDEYRRLSNNFYVSGILFNRCRTTAELTFTGIDVKSYDVVRC